MSERSAFEGRAYVVDTSAWARATRRAAAGAWTRAMLAGQLWMIPVVKLKLLNGTSDQTEFAELERRLDDVREAPLDRAVARTGGRPCASWPRSARSITGFRSRTR